ncbi:MAG TPA: CoB--CoM heterodisulfide reductase iron-sulfur subunit B family protein [Dehalococcoidales bacterium]|nr:CoB--CoM heterodisulfide reductase iron-sulfur subunit B family protein [Dehalococcoidales bacterium]
MGSIKYGYYPGCSLESTAKEYNLSMFSAAKLLDVELAELHDWNCCGASSGHCTNYELSLALPARNLAIAEKAGLNIAVACAACYLRFKQTNHDLRKNDELRQKIEKIIEMPYSGKVEVRHLLEVFEAEVGLDEIGKRVKKPLKNLKLAAYYGCYLVRPPEVTEFDNPEQPVILDNLLSALGAQPVDYTHKTECCGGGLLLGRVDIVKKLVDDICQAALDAGASGIVTACPLCMANLDTRQPKTQVPIIHFSELVAIALGAGQAEYSQWLKKHINNPLPILQERGII